MNKISSLTFLIAIFSLISCNGMAQNSVEKAVEKTDICNLDAKNKYEVYIPQRNSNEKLPLLVIIDAHGSGKFALNKFKLGADKFPTVIVASDYVKNGFEGFDGAIQTLVEDVRQKYPTNQTLFLSGFSGGARMALGYALNHPTDGLILCGALANSQQLKSLSCPVFSISGMDDFNFMETAQYLFNEAIMPQNLKIELTNESHSWPDSLMLSNAFGFLYLAKPDKSSIDKTQLSDYCNNQIARIDTLKSKGDYLKAELIAKNLATTEPFNKEKDFTSVYNHLKTSVLYANQLNKLGESLTLELTDRKKYLDAFQTQDSAWWNAEIKNLNDNIKNAPDEYSKDSYKRVKSFLGIICYSYCNQAVKAKNAETLVKVLNIYYQLEPQNPDMFYFSAFPFYWKGDSAKTVFLLKKAIKLGFSDTNQMNEDFPKSILSGVY